MDQFGVLVESIGFKAHGKSSAPLADLKNTHKIPNSNNNNNKSTNGFPQDIGINSINGDDLDGIFRSSNGYDSKPSKVSNFDDVFGGGFGFDSGINVSNSGSFGNGFDDDDDVFGLKKSSVGSSSVDHFDLLGNKVSPSVKKANSVDDLIGSFGRMGVKPSENSGEKKGSGLNFDDLLENFNGNRMNLNEVKKNSAKRQESGFGSDDLLSGFGVNGFSSNGKKSEAKQAPQSARSFTASAEDPFGMFESTQGSSKANYGASGVEDYLDTMFSPGTGSSTRPSQTSSSEDSVYDALFNNNVVPKAEKTSSTKSSYNTNKASSMATSTDDFSYLFGMGDAPPSGEFQEIKGESEERRKARYNHHIATRERMIKALNEKNKRDLQAQQEQDEKHRVGATLDGDIKRWAVGKEGNLRALLSSLQNILWAGSGWQSISLTDLITSTAVKKAYYKATLYVHPDKVQQKGATIQQKYIAEKVFDLLKEAWTKFNAEEFKKQ
uniref:auxilin-like protein 1 n=1 Tax=Erigeron canadensis TaxID=72917 RepID=UPI001CB8AC37|nr:auxilin-like protein 1 [Erigeron canadensis]